MKDKRASHPQSIMNRKHPSSVTHSPFPYCSLPSTNTLPSYPFHTSPSPHTGILLCPLPLHPILTQHHSHHNIAIPTKAHNKTDPKKDTYKRIRKKEKQKLPIVPRTRNTKFTRRTDRPPSLLLAKAHRLLDRNGELLLQRLEVLVRRQVESVEAVSR